MMTIHSGWFSGRARASVLASLGLAGLAVACLLAVTASGSVAATAAGSQPCGATAGTASASITATGTATATPSASPAPSTTCSARETETLTSTATARIPAAPVIAVGDPSLAGGAVIVPISLLGADLAPYTAYQVHLRWDPKAFTFSSANNAAAVLPEPTFCVNPIVDDDGAGVVYACLTLSGQQTTSAGLMATVALTPIRAGCSALHLTVDDGTGWLGTFTMNTATKVVVMATSDGSADQEGRSCSPAVPAVDRPE